MNKAKYKAPCHTCVDKETCNVLKIYQVVVYECKCLEYKQQRRTDAKENK